MDIVSYGSLPDSRFTHRHWISTLSSMFGWLKKINRAAVLTDKTWLKKASELEGALVRSRPLAGTGEPKRRTGLQPETLIPGF
jgi:hypothetical protein